MTENRISLDPVAAHFSRTATFFRNEALAMAVELRRIGEMLATAGTSPVEPPAPEPADPEHEAWLAEQAAADEAGPQ